ncbi:restriction endonuclease subunit S [Lacinutrix sp. Bg11-31]|uniref:restriction endonuclease subunit S n=1 Tax=Lacinutrix sp. Bg11-31 TaxID=2057808 RepID=UPI000C319B85|nr:restriction endonuclease subunit S [Lacinutrix sp. Bg11-31]AUC82263.1 hypothetical protein CW733_09025 [Lacinutrix sp. Bg11-31]
MNKQKHKIVPSLRFPEFENGWEISDLGNKKVSVFVNDKTPKAELDIKTYISTENLLPNYGGVKKSNKLPDSGSFTTYKKGDILIANIRPYLKKVWFSDKEGTASNDVIVFRAGSSISEFFLQHILKNDVFINYVMKGAKGVKMPRGDKSLMKKYSVYFPKPKEQEKIASCLSSLDNLITSETEKLDYLKNHKKGLLQQLFPVNGETKPQFRFPEFENNGDWEEDKLSNLVLNISPPKKLKSSQFQENGKYPIIDQSQNEIAGWSDDKKALVKNDFPLIVFGDHTCALKIVESPFIQGADGIKILKGNTLIDTRYLFYALQSNPLIMKEYKRHYSILKDKIISYPNIDTDEQPKIANCISSLDDLIEAQTTKIEALKDHKKGLMQRLFPNINDIS